MESKMRFVIHGRIPSKKNSKIWTGKMLISSKKYREWEDLKIRELKKYIVPTNINTPCKIIYNFYGPDKRKRDLSNKIESINDLLVRFGLIEDDNVNILTELEVNYKGLDREKPRCEVELKQKTL